MSTSYDDLTFREKFQDILTFRWDIALPFSPERFQEARLPIKAGQITKLDFEGMPSCLDMLIKLPGHGLVLPAPYLRCEGVSQFITQAFEHEDRILPGWRDSYYAYLTFDRRYVKADETHRNGGWHFDGMQGARHNPKLPACHQYVVATSMTTEFSNCPTDASGLDELKHNWFKALGAQIPDSHPVFRPASYQIVVMSAYQHHRSPVARPEDEGWRTFMRLDISRKQQDRLGNSINPHLPAPWTFQERNLPEGLEEPVTGASWEKARKFDG